MHGDLGMTATTGRDVLEARSVTSLLFGVLLLSACGGSVTEAELERAVSDALAAQAAEQDSEPEPEPEPEPTGYDSELDYRLSLVYSTELVGEIVAATMEWTYPEHSPSDIAEVLEGARDAIQTHIDHHNGTTPPAGYVRPQALMIESWQLIDDSFAMNIRGLDAKDPALVGQAIDLLVVAMEKIDEANALLPSS
jgi:hypothetical protein